MKKILSIDDEPMMLKCLSVALKGRGYELFITSDPEEGLRILKNEKIDLVLLDIRMPVKSGFDIYKEMRTFTNIPAMFVTAYPKSFTTDSDELVKMWQDHFADGTTDIIYKPFDLDSLYDKVEALIGTADE